MAEPTTTTILGALGLKSSVMLAGFAGSVISLSFITGLGIWGRISAVFTGTLTAAYATPVAVAYWDMTDVLGNGVGFILGLTAMNLVPAVIGAANWIHKNIGSLMSKKFGIEEEKEKKEEKKDEVKDDKEEPK